MDSNHDKGLQRALCYRYTIGQWPFKLAVSKPVCKWKMKGIRPKRLGVDDEFRHWIIWALWH